MKFLIQCLSSTLEHDAISMEIYNVKLSLIKIETAYHAGWIFVA